MGGLPCGSCYKGRAVSAVRSRYFVHQNGKVAFPTENGAARPGNRENALKNQARIHETKDACFYIGVAGQDQAVPVLQVKDFKRPAVHHDGFVWQLTVLTRA